MRVQTIQQQCAQLASPIYAKELRRSFKTGPGEYGYGEQFLGIRMPSLRKLACDYAHLPLPDVQVLLHARMHEERLLALLILVGQYQKGDMAVKQQVYDLYLAHRQQVNNWDLVDLSAHHIVGAHLHTRTKSPLYELADSSSLWDRRIAMVATWYFIREGHHATTCTLAQRLLQDQEPLIHKAVGWMLREVGKRDLEVLTSFLDTHLPVMPRTTLRYAIERFQEPLRTYYLKKPYNR